MSYQWHKEPDYRALMAKAVFDQDVLGDICAMPEEEFGPAFDMQRWNIPSRESHNFFFYKNNGSDILAVAHLDTVADEDTRTARFAQTEAGLVIHSRALDDRLGAYVIADMLPALGLDCDLLFTVGEENGQSTAEFFEPEKDYNWMIEFDRGGTDVVMYQYDDFDTRGLVRKSGARVGNGSFSDIAYLDHLGVKGFNWGVGYQDYHGPRSHAYLEDTFEMVGYFLQFHHDNFDTKLPHVRKPKVATHKWWEHDDKYKPKGKRKDDRDDYKEWWERVATEDLDALDICLGCGSSDIDKRGVCGKCGGCADCGETLVECQCFYNDKEDAPQSYGQMGLRSLN